MSSDARLKQVVTSRSLAGSIPATVESVIVLDRDRPAIDLESSENPSVDVHPDQLAYCLYTSGSTGKPKGVLVEHLNVVRLLINDRLQFRFSAADVWTLFHAYSFDFSVWEMFGALLYGGRLVIVPPDCVKDPRRFAELLVNEKVTVLNQTPSAFYELMQEIEDKSLGLRYVIFGGEALHPARVDRFLDAYPHVGLVNMYGITETTVHVTFKELSRSDIGADSPSVGVPIPTTTVYVMDEQQRLLPIGAVGEICVGGAGVARGYLNRPELTAERFVSNPYRPGERLYRSGDRGRRLSNGDVAYMGRLDNQVQVRGYRVELGEVETAIASHPAIQDVVVVAKEQAGTHRLAAYYTLQKNAAPPTLETLKVHLRGLLPEYMIPAALISLEKLPLTSNGKVDRNALPEATTGWTSAAPFVDASDEIEQQLADIWKKILGREKVSVDHNFFDLGGDSLLLIQVRIQIRARLNRDLPVADLFRHPTIVTLANYLKGESPEKATSHSRADKRKAAIARRKSKAAE